MVGGGDTALEDACFLSAICKDVYIIHRRDTFRGTHLLYERAKKQTNIHFVLDSVVSEITGDATVTGVRVQNKNTNAETNLSVDAVFVVIGTAPESAIFHDFVDLDKDGYILADVNLQTSVPGVFAAGDVRQKPCVRLSLPHQTAHRQFTMCKNICWNNNLKNKGAVANCYSP